MPNLVFAQIREESVFFLYFDVVYEGTVSSAVSSIDVHEFVSKAEPVTAGMGYGQRFQAVQKCWTGSFVMESRFLLAFLLGKFPLMSARAKRAEFGTGFENYMANNNRQCRLAMFPEYIWHFRDFSSPIKLLLSTHLIVLQHLNIDEDK